MLDKICLVVSFSPKFCAFQLMTQTLGNNSSHSHIVMLVIHQNGVNGRLEHDVND